VNGVDFVLGALLAVLLLLGLFKGLARILIGIGALIASFLLASLLHQNLAPHLPWIESEPLRRLAAYLLILVGTLVAGAIAGWLARRLLKAAMLGWADRLGGAALGLVAALLVAALVILPVLAYAPAGERALQGSVLAPYVTSVADLATRLVPDDLSRRYREHVESLRRYWREKTGARGSASRRDGPAAT
jgi:membrane protein required for colicin V production